MEPKVTVIIPTYNRQEIKALPSVLNQTFKDFEVIVIDDCSVSPVKIVENVRYFRNETNKGKSYSVNFAAKQAKGKYILVVDDDNEIAPTFLEETVAVIEKGSISEEVFGNDPWHAVSTGRIVKHAGYDDYAEAYYQLGYGFAAIDWGWLIRKEVFDKIQYDETLYGDEDADFGIQFFKHFRALTLNKPLQTAYATDNSGVSYPSEKRLLSLKRFYEKNWKEYEKAGPRDLAFLNRFVGRNLYLAGKKKEAITYFWKAFVCYKNRRTLIHFLVSLINYKAYYLLMRIEEKYYSKQRLKQLRR